MDQFIIAIWLAAVPKTLTGLVKIATIALRKLKGFLRLNRIREGMGVLGGFFDLASKLNLP